MKRLIPILLILLAFATSARADVFQWLRIGGEGAAVGISEFALKPVLAPKHCRWCATNPVDDAVRDALVWSNGNIWINTFEFELADILSYGTAGADSIIMTMAAGHDAPTVIESASVAALTTQIIKFSVGRERPYAHDVSLGDDDNLSFVSGHTAIATAEAVSAGMVTHKPWVWGVGLGLAGATGYLRIAGDKHYLTDVLAGAAVGALCGWAVTKLTYTPTTSAARTYSVPLFTEAW